MRPPLQPSRLEEKGGQVAGIVCNPSRWATEVSPLSCHALYTFSPLIKDQHRNTAEGQDILAETQSHTPSSEC